MREEFLLIYYGPDCILWLKIELIWGGLYFSPANMSLNTFTPTTPTYKSTRKHNAWSVFQRKQKAEKSAGYEAAENKSKYCSEQYKVLYATKEAKDAYFQAQVAADPQLQAELVAAAMAAAAAPAAVGPKPKRISARDQFQKEWYANLRIQLGIEKVGLRPTECAAAWKTVTDEEKVALKARCQARLAIA